MRLIISGGDDGVGVGGDVARCWEVVGKGCCCWRWWSGGWDGQGRGNNRAAGHVWRRRAKVGELTVALKPARA